MLRLAISWKIVLIALAFTAFCAVLVAFSDGFQNCISNDKQQESANHSENESAPILFARRYERCLGNYVTDNKDAIGAISAFFVAIFTFTLWLSTAALWGASDKQLVHLEETAERQLRAYVLVDRADLVDGVTLIPPQPNRNNIPGATIFIKNFGITPAYNVKSWSEIDVIQIAQIARLAPPPLMNMFGMTVGPGGFFTKSHWFNRPITPIEIQDIQNGARAICVYGRIEYTDAFKHERFTNFKLIYITSTYPPIGGPGVFYSAESGNDST